MGEINTVSADLLTEYVPPSGAYLSTGIHRIKPDTYHADLLRPGVTLSSTLARLILDRSPLHAWTAHPRLNPQWEPTDRKTFDIGRAAHRAVLGAGGDYVAYPPEILASNGAASTKEAKAWAQEQRAAGRTPLKADEVDQIGAMADAVQRRLAAMGIKMDPARSELTALAEVDGVWCRAMIDNAPEQPLMLPGGKRKVLIDFKTCEDASPEACRRSVETYHYDFQQRFYQDAWKAATGEDRDFLFIFTEKAAPHETTVVHLLSEAGHSADWAEDAGQKVAYTRAMWRHCVEANDWPGYPGMIVQIGASPFHKQRWQDTASRAAVTSNPTREAIRRATNWQSPE
jgi:hypothetical protein